MKLTDLELAFRIEEYRKATHTGKFGRDRVEVLEGIWLDRTGRAAA